MSARAQALVDGGYQAAEVLGEVFSHVEGMVMPWDTETDVGMFCEKFERGSLTASLVKNPKVALLLFHDARSFAVGHAVDWDDQPTGLFGRFKLAMSAVAQYAAQQARDDFLTGLSVGFSPIRSSWTYAAEFDPSRGPAFMDKVTRHEARLHEVSLTPTPAYVDARVHSVTAESLDGSTRSIENNMRLFLRTARRHGVGHSMPPSRRQVPEPTVAVAPDIGQRVDDLEATVENHDVRITTLEGLGGNLTVSLTPSAPGGQSAPQGTLTG
jgi:HK97 family phage prohead protease